uniref:Polysaccharide pyruvyl transferase domain-containing protein n=1 Tax=viral metagenome TaxID=1070528 RepID=A0A6C0HD39_9ZZZZ
MFIVSPRFGLSNQLQSIVKGILLGIKYNRDVYFNKFQINVYNNNLCDINDVIDISKTNEYLKTLDIKIKIYDKIDKNIIENIHEFLMPNVDYEKMAWINCINNEIEKSLDKNVIYLGNIVSLSIYDSFNDLVDDFNNLYYKIYANIVFNKKFYEIKDNIKKELHLINYSTTHLRIEDDAVNEFYKFFNNSIDEYNNNLLSFYDNAVKNIKTPMYICSGILHYGKERNYNYYVNLIKNNNLLCDKSKSFINDYYLNNRELLAIIDLLIAYDSESFIGHSVSSFSLAVSSYFKCKNNTNVVLF